MFRRVSKRMHTMAHFYTPTAIPACRAAGELRFAEHSSDRLTQGDNQRMEEIRAKGVQTRGSMRILGQIMIIYCFLFQICRACRVLDDFQRQGDEHCHEDMACLCLCTCECLHVCVFVSACMELQSLPLKPGLNWYIKAIQNGFPPSSWDREKFDLRSALPGWSNPWFLSGKVLAFHCLAEGVVISRLKQQIVERHPGRTRDITLTIDVFHGWWVFIVFGLGVSLFTEVPGCVDKAACMSAWILQLVVTWLEWSQQPLLLMGHGS